MLQSCFRTLETGDLPLDRGLLRYVTVKSAALQSRVDTTLFLPAQAQGRHDLPVVILLHGVYGSHWAWALSGRAHLTLQALIDAGEVAPMILAMPSDGLFGDGSAYLNHPGGNFENWIVDELPRLVAIVTGNIAGTPLFLGGLSMGGYGAMRIGASHPQRFAAFAGHSSITRLHELASFIEEPLSAYEVPDSDDVSVIGSLLAHRRELPPFRFDCGRDDPLIVGNHLLNQQLTDAGIAHDFDEHSGGHDWSYWTEHVATTFRFFQACLPTFRHDDKAAW